MIGRCIHNTGSNLGPSTRGHFYSPETVFNVEIGNDYVVVGLGVFETVLLVLIRDDTGKPNWLPIGLFEFDAPKLPTGWEFALLEGTAASGGETSNRWVARWGYSELVRDASHSDALIEREPRALEVFFRELERRSSDASQ